VSAALGLITTSFPETGDGSEAAGSFVHDLVVALAERVPVRVVAPGRATRIEMPSPNISVYRYRAPPRPLSTLRLWHPADAWKAVAVVRAGRRAALDMVADRRVGHCWALWGLPSGYWARVAARRARIGYSVWTLGSDIWSLGRIPVVRGVLARVLAGASAVSADGYVLADDTARIAGRDVSFLPSSRDLPVVQKVARAAGPFRLLFLGRWHPNKGIDLLLDALALLHDDDWQRIAEIAIMGGGPLDASVRERCAAFAANGRPVRVGGYLDKGAAAEAFSQADFLVIPSRIESIPVIFSDALASRTPMLVTPVGDLPRLLQTHAVGAVAARVDASAIAEALGRLLRTSPADYVDALATASAGFSLRGTVVPRMIASLAGNSGADRGTARA
jgi:glycosyltransferase involved in cell wall biosynthesis